MDYLPSEEERGWLLDALAELCARRGAQTFLEAPLLEPNDRFFPDAWTPGARGVRTVARRLLTYAGLAELDPVVQIFETEKRAWFEGDRRGHRKDGAAAWFAGIEEGRCFFGSEADGLTDPHSGVAA